VTAVQIITGRASKLVAGLAITAACVLAGIGIAAAYWIITDSSNFAAATGDSLAGGATPSVSVTPSNSSTVTIAFAKVAMSDGSRVGSYTVRRYPAAGGAATVASVSCSDAATTRTCTETTVPDGSWKYTDTPALGLHWTGAESTLSAAVTVDTTAPTVTVNQATGQADPTKSRPVHFTAVFSEAVAAPPSSAVVLGGTAGRASASITVTATDASHYDISVDGLTSDGTITAALAPSAASDAAGNASAASTATDNTVTYDTTPPGAPVITTWTSPIKISNKTAVTVGGTAEPNASVALAITDAGSAHSESRAFTADGAGAWSASSIDTSTLNDGTVTYTVTATDGAGNTSSPATKNVTKDTTAPSGGSVSYTDGTLANGSVTVTLTNGTDTGSGINTATTSLQRQSAAYTNGNTCSTYGSFTTIATGPTSPYVDATVSSANCYRYQYVVSDNVGNSTSYTSTNAARVPPVAAAIDSIPNPKDGRANNGDKIVYTFSTVMDPASIMSGWNGSSTNVTASFDHCSGSGSPDCLTVQSVQSVNLGSVNLQGSYVANGSSKHYTATATMVMATVNGRSVVTLALTSSPSSNDVLTDTNTYQMMWTPSASAKDTAGNAMSTTAVTQASAKENF
jgi:hypothetical protein